MEGLGYSAIAILAVVAWVVTKALDGQEKVAKCGPEGKGCIVAAAIAVTAGILCLIGAALGGGE